MSIFADKVGFLLCTSTVETCFIVLVSSSVVAHRVLINRVLNNIKSYSQNKSCHARYLQILKENKMKYLRIDKAQYEGDLKVTSYSMMESLS